MDFRFGTVLHPTARASRTAQVGAGCIVSAGVVVAGHTTVGCHVIVNRGALIGHHTVIGDCVTVSPGANIAGCVRIGAGTLDGGMGAIILDRISVGANAIVGAGACSASSPTRDGRGLGTSRRSGCA